MTTVRENLIVAKAMIDVPEKWMKGSFHNGECRCAVGAIGGIPDEDGRLDALRAVKVYLPQPFRVLMEYNDHPNTTHADIMALFDRAIAAQEPLPSDE